MKWLQRGSVGIAEDDTIITAYLLEEATTVYLLVVLSLNSCSPIEHKSHFLDNNSGKKFSLNICSKVQTRRSKALYEKHKKRLSYRCSKSE